MTNPRILKVAVPGPFRKLFDYLLPEEDKLNIPLPGCRILVPFGSRQVIGIVIESQQGQSSNSEKRFQLKSVIEILDIEPSFDAGLLNWLMRVSQYYHHPLGDTLLTALPVLLRKEKHPTPKKERYWQITNHSDDVFESLKRAPKQLALYQFLQAQKRPVIQHFLSSQFSNAATTLKQLQSKNLVELIEKFSAPKDFQRETRSTVKQLTADQQQACDAIIQQLNKFHVTLLNGVTGSGKTEVYIHVSRQAVAQGKQVLFLLPEIALTPQLVSRFQSQFDCNVDVLHSGLNDSERFTIWHKVKNNQVAILIGTRSAIFSPFNSLGLIIIDEEHDLSFKQQDGLRYSTKDIAMLRGQLNHFPVVLGSATPSFESIANAEKPHFQELLLTRRAGKALPPKIHTLDIKGRQLTEGIANELLSLIEKTLNKNEQVILFLNQRGYAPALICHQCGLVDKCPRCDRNMTIHQARQRLTCHHCGYEKKLPMHCPSCQHDDLRPIGYGTERIEKCLQALFPETDIIRIDRDTTSRKNAILSLLEKIRNDRGQILLGTQMLAKGHDFPNVTLVGILNADQGLFGADLRSEERLAQLILQVAGRAGRAEKPGQVVIQTHHPEHALWNTLINESYNSYAHKALEERKQAKLPPFTYAALLRSEATRFDYAMQFLSDVRTKIKGFQDHQVEIYGPVSAPMERRAGKFRTQLLLMCENRERLHQCIATALNHIETLSSAKKVRWNLDVDPLDMS